MRPTGFWLAAAVGSALLSAPVGAQDTTVPKTVALTYRWPEQARVDVDVVRVNVTAGNASSDSVEIRLALRLALRPRAGGRELRLVRYEATIRGQAVGMPVVFAERDSALTPRLLVDSTGNVTALTGFEAFAAGLREATRASRDSIARNAPALLPLYDAMISGSRFTNIVTDIWLETVTLWIGGALTVGRAMEVVDTLQSPDPFQRLIPIRRSFVVVGQVPCAEGLPADGCAQLGLLTQVDGDVVRARIQSAFARADSAVTVDSATLQVSSQVWTDPATLVPRAFERIEDLRYRQRPAGGGVQVHAQRTVTAMWVRVTPLESPLHVATAAGDLEAAMSALAAGEPVDFADDEGRTPLLVAVQLGHEGLSRRLVSAGASVQVAYTAARRRGDTDAMRWLRGTGRLEAQPLLTLSEIAAWADSVTDAVAIPPLADRVVADDTDLDARRALARTLIALHRDSLAEREARRLLERDACDAAALHVLVFVFGQRFGRGDAPADSALAYANRQATCAPRSGTAWNNVALISEVVGDSAAVRQAIAALADLDYITPAQRAAARWALEAVPRDALLVSDVGVDKLTFRLLQREGLRPDVRIVYASPAVALALALAQGRPATAVPWIGLDSTAWRSEGAHLVLAPTPLGRITRATGWPALKQMARVMRGPQVVEEDSSFVRRAYDLRVALAIATARYLSSVDPTPALTGPAHLADMDSASRLMLELAPSLDRTPEYGREIFVGVQGWIADVWLHLGRPWRGIPHFRDALAVSPAADNLWNSLAYHYLVSGDLSGADSAARRAVLMGESLSALLNLATLARLRGQADSALAALERARVKLDSLRTTEPDSTWSWSLSHLPRSLGDTVTIRPAASVYTHDARDAFFHHNRALALALRGEAPGADLAVWQARALYDDPAFRCVIVSLSEATRAFAPVTERARAWYLQFERAMRAGASCPTQ